MVLMVLAFAGPVLAQAPHNASIVVLVADQSGAVIPGARVTVVNEQTRATREAVSGADGSATFPALPLTGTYSVVVAKAGFAEESRGGLSLRSSEVATLRVKLLVAGETSQVTVYGTGAGVRADPQIGVHLPTEAIDE